MKEVYKGLLTSVLEVRRRRFQIPQLGRSFNVRGIIFTVPLFAEAFAPVGRAQEAGFD